MVLKRSVNIFSICLPLTLGISSLAFANSQLKTLSDSELADVNGQALMSLSYLAPRDNANPMKNVSNNNVGFYKLGLEAELNLNANIKNLQSYSLKSIPNKVYAYSPPPNIIGAPY